MYAVAWTDAGDWGIGDDKVPTLTQRYVQLAVRCPANSTRVNTILSMLRSGAY